MSIFGSLPYIQLGVPPPLGPYGSDIDLIKLLGQRFGFKPVFKTERGFSPVITAVKLNRIACQIKSVNI